MAKKGDFRTPTEAFITSKPLDIKTVATSSVNGIEIPEGYRLAREPKSARLTILTRPTTRAALKQIAARKNLSVNEMLNQVLDAFIQSEKEGSA